MNQDEYDGLLGRLFEVLDELDKAHVEFGNEPKGQHFYLVADDDLDGVTYSVDAVRVGPRST